MKKILLAASVLLAHVSYSQKVESTDLEVPIKHTALFPFANAKGGRLQVYFNKTESPAGNAITINSPATSLDMEVIGRLGLFASFDLEKYWPHSTLPGIKVSIKPGMPVVSFENATTAQGYFYKKGICILPAIAEIKNDNGELLKTLVLSNDAMRYTTYFIGTATHKQNMTWYKDYYAKTTNAKALDSARKIFESGPPYGVKHIGDLESSFNRDAQMFFTDQVLANAFNNVLLNLNYMLKAGLESIDRKDKYKVYTIGPKKEKEASDYIEEEKACTLLSQAVEELKKSNFDLTPSSTKKLEDARVLFNKLIAKSETDLKQGMKSALKFNSEYYNALFCNGALIDMFLGYYREGLQKIERYEPAEKLGDAFKLKKLMDNTNYKIDFTTAATFREKIMRGRELMRTLNP